MSLYTHGYMNVDAEPMTFDEVRKLAKQLEIPDFDVMELDKYKTSTRDWPRRTKNQRIASSGYPLKTVAISGTSCLAFVNPMAR